MFGTGCEAKKSRSLSPVKGLYDFSTPKHFSDVVFVVEDKKFNVHKSTMSIWSPVFEKMFSSKFLESKAKEIPLPGKSKVEFEELLQIIYSNGVAKKVTEENYEYLLKLAEEYQMDRVKELCITFLIPIIKESNSLEIYQIVERFQLEKVMSKCIDKASNRTSTNEIAHKKHSASLEDCKEFNDLKPEVKLEICMKRLKKLELAMTSSDSGYFYNHRHLFL